jgi:hypothetical protein
MTNLIIGLCFGVASAVALAIMWRMAEQLRKDMQSRKEPPPEKRATPRDDA